MSVPGIGPIISSAMVAAIGSGDAFSKGRDFAAPLCIRRPGRRNSRKAQTKEQQKARKLSNDVANTFTRRGLREDETTMEDRSSRRMRTLVTQIARSRLGR